MSSVDPRVVDVRRGIYKTNEKHPNKKQINCIRLSNSERSLCLPKFVRLKVETMGNFFRRTSQQQTSWHLLRSRFNSSCICWVAPDIRQSSIVVNELLNVSREGFVF
jgi:hypothetical protein